MLFPKSPITIHHCAGKLSALVLDVSLPYGEIENRQKIYVHKGLVTIIQPQTGIISIRVVSLLILFPTEPLVSYRCKNVGPTFFIPVTFFSCHVFCVFNVFYFVNVFILKKHSLKIPSRSSRSTFETTEANYCLDFIKKVAICRAALYPLYIRSIALGDAYSDTAVVTSCSRRSQYVKSWITTNSIG